MAQPACAIVSAQRSDGYVRRRPEESVLYQTVAKHWPALREELEEAGGLPRFVVREFEEYLRCGILEEGCLHLVCRQCGLSQVVALSCKKRGFCPACLGRRMADTAVHLERYVLPAVPIRHWICSLPWGLRALLGYDRKLCADVVGAFVGEVNRSLRFRAKHTLRLKSVNDAHTGCVAAIQRTDSALRLNVHFHVLALDGVYVRDEKSAALVFHPLATPTRAEVAAVARRTAERIEKILRAHGRSLDPEMQDDEPAELELCRDQPGLAACYAAAARGASVKSEKATLRLVVSQDQPENAAAFGRCRRAARRSARCQCSCKTTRRRARPETARATLPLHHPSAVQSGSARASSRRPRGAHSQERLARRHACRRLPTSRFFGALDRRDSATIVSFTSLLRDPLESFRFTQRSRS